MFVKRSGGRWLLLFAALGLLSLLVSGCSPEEDCAQCTPGESRCSPDERSVYLCKKLASTGCYQTVSRACLPGESCKLVNGKALCQTESLSCENACQLTNRKCENGQPYLCTKNPTDVCPQWKAEDACPTGETCDNATGTCKNASCQPTKPETVKKCDGNSIFWFDDCGNKGAQIGTCKSDETCKDGKCVSTGCVPKQPQQTRKCENNAVYWFDDCGQRGALVESCGGNKKCENGSCVSTGCTPTNNQKTKGCVGNELYWYDDCGKKQALIERCQPPKSCQNKQCSCVVTVVQSTRKCIGRSAYWFDNCGNRGSLINTCSATEKCENGSCVNNNQCPVTHACAIGQTRCQGNAVQNCVTNPQNSCRTWGSAQSCPSGQVCQNGSCITEPRKCSVGVSGTCSSNADCCQGQTCRSVLVTKVCSPCNTDSDCPKISGVLPTTCCSTLGTKYCSLVCL